MTNDDKADKHELPRATSDKSTSPAEDAIRPPDSRDALTEKATVFLKDASVRNAPLRKRIDFLLSKGLSEAEAEDLIAESQSSDQPEDENEDEVRSTPPPASTSPQPPPIITYPEFLVHSRKPPPVVTAQNLLTAAYLVSGAAATVFCTGKYLVEPMRESLDFARHALLEVANGHVRTLNDKLEQNVSRVPPEASELSQETSSDEATRYFSRTKGTQTSPRLSRSNSPLPSQQKPLDQGELTPDSSPIKLERVRHALADLQEGADQDRALQTSLEDLHSYLNKLPHSSNPTSASHASSGLKQSTDGDLVSKLRGDVKGLKGILLNARNFPAASAR